MRSFRTWFWLTTIVLVVGVVAMFIVQNWSRATDLSLDLYFVAWHLSKPAPLPLVAGSFTGLGLLVGLLLPLFFRFRDRRSSRASSGYGGSDDETWT